ncbi:MAG: TraU family protein [Rhizobacter sp.]
MKRGLHQLLTALCAFAALAFAGVAQAELSPARKLTTCEGKFPNPITDVCWSCMFPISIAGVAMGDGDDILQGADNGDPICICPAPPPVFERVGATLGYWEPVRSVDVSRKPFCLVGLGGIDLASDGGGGTATGGASSFLPMPEHTQQHRSSGAQDGSFYQAHWYANPVMYLLEIVTDAGCVETGGFDLGYLTEVDPLWNDDELTNILNFESALFSNLIVQATCAVDCVAASIPKVGMPLPFMMWCAGCNGSNFPLNGNVQAHIGGVQAASLIAERLVHKLQRELVEWTFHTFAAVCGPFPNPIIDKVAFKQQLAYPIPQTEKEPYCCNWMGQTTTLSGAGKEYPYSGEDFNFFMFRKRVCCLF